jgi:hypothetical protein
MKTRKRRKSFLKHVIIAACSFDLCVLSEEEISLSCCCCSKIGDDVLLTVLTDVSPSRKGTAVSSDDAMFLS